MSESLHHDESKEHFLTRGKIEIVSETEPINAIGLCPNFRLCRSTSAACLTWPGQHFERSFVGGGKLLFLWLLFVVGDDKF